MATDKIKRAITWIRKSLDITEKTTNPGTVDGTIQPTIDTFGWERLTETTIQEVSSPAPNAFVDFGAAFTDTESIRLILKASGRHTDTGVTHTVSLVKRLSSGGAEVGHPMDRPTIIVGELASMIGQTYLVAGQILQFQFPAALVVGAIAAEFEFVDIPIGEYISPLP